MKVFSLFLNDKNKGHFTLTEISILNDQLIHYYHVGNKDDATKEEELEEFKKYVTNFKDLNEVFDNVKDHLIYFLNEYMKQDTLKDDDFTFYAESVAELEGHNNQDVAELIEKLDALNDEEIKEILSALMYARDFFEKFIIADPLSAIKDYKAKAEIYEDAYRKSMEANMQAIEINNTTKKVIEEVKNRYDMLQTFDSSKQNTNTLIQ